MVQKSGAEHIMMLDPHSPQLVGFFDIPVDALKVTRTNKFHYYRKSKVPSMGFMRIPHMGFSDLQCIGGCPTVHAEISD